MPDTLQALAVLLVGVLPGALHVWASERESGRWGISLSDRVLRFVGTTALYQVVFGYPVYLLWTHFLHHRVLDTHGRAHFENRLANGTIPGWLWLIPLLYVGIPLTIGTIAGVSAHRWPRLARVFLGRDPAPRAWDFLFAARRDGVVLARLKTEGRWIGGWFSEGSYASGYPEEPMDLYLERAYRVLSDGTFAEGDSPGGYDETGSGLLIRWDEIEELQFFPAEANA